MSKLQSYIFYASTTREFEGQQSIRTPSGKTVFVRIEESEAPAWAALDTAKPLKNETVLNSMSLETQASNL